MTVPDAAIKDAYAAYQRAWLTHNQANPLFAEKVVREVLEAAAPHIAAAERERIRQLALTEQAKYPLGTIASHALETFTAQLTEGTTT